jgi:predicted nuclease of predicted toxin-antitoxin system
MRFVLDEDVDAAAVGSFLRRQGHESWTVVEAGLQGADDDAVTIYADDRRAVLITHDAEATARRRRFTIGRHVFLRCPQLEAVDVLRVHLAEVVRHHRRRSIGVLELRRDRIVFHPPNYEGA